MNLAVKYEAGRNYFLKQVRNRVMKQTLGLYPAPLKIIDVCIVAINEYFFQFLMLCSYFQTICVILANLSVVLAIT